MQTNTILNNRMSDLNRKVKVLEWDLSKIKDGVLRARKQAELDRLREDLKALQGIDNLKNRDVEGWE
ncbi:hypothetical protein JW711_05020 [Candidatus Woesearchaeota archaeon]|nr:hypothetical protein [Candidatus Woesearchaeota archaeon]